MKKFLFRFLLFLLPIVLFAYFADLVISRNLRKSNSHAIGEYPSWNIIFEGKLNSQIVIYGNSRAWQHFNPLMIEESLQCPTFNLGINGHPFELQYLRHSLLLKYNQKPKLIIQSVDTGTLWKREDLHNPDQILPYMLWNSEISTFTAAMEGYNIYDYNLPLLRYSGKLDALKASFKMLLAPKSDKLERINGYKGQEKEWEDNVNKKIYNERLDKSVINLFDNYLKECKEKKIMIVLVYSPEFIDRQKLVGNRDEIVNLYKKFSLKYDIPYIDFSDSEISKNRDFFYNGFHMNKKGSEIFTQELIQKIQGYKSIKTTIINN